MKKIISALLLSAAFTTSVFAAEMSGIVKLYEDSTKSLSLEDGSVFKVAPDVSMEGIITGAKVKVTFDETTKEASSVVVDKM